MSSDINFFAETNFRNFRKKFGIKPDDRRRHLYIIGKTGMGKTAMMANMAIQDIREGRGLCFVDPHGEAAEGLLDFIPSNRINDVVYFNSGDLSYPLAFNVMEKVDPDHRHLVASGLMAVFKKIWPDVWSARMEYILNNAVLALLDYPGSTLLGINRMLGDANYRAKVVEHLSDPVVKAFWVSEFARYSQRYEVEATAAIQNKIGQFISAPLIRNIIGQVRSSIDMREVMDKGKILICNLSKGKTGEDNSMLLGGLLIAKIQLAAMSRVDIPEEKRSDFFLYVDEFQNFATRAFVSILSEARKYRLSLILGHQYISQMEDEVRDAVFGNVGTIVSFRVGAEDAEFLEKEFMPEFYVQDIVNLSKYNIYLKLLIDGVAGRPFSAVTLPPFKELENSNRDKIIKISRERYGTKRAEVEDKIAKWLEFTDSLPSSSSSRKSSSEELYEAECAMCKKPVRVPFKPDGLRPVYCKSCLKKVQKAGDLGKKKIVAPDDIEKQQTVTSPKEKKPVVPVSAFSLKETLRKAPISFLNAEKQKRRKKREITSGKEGLKQALSEILKTKESKEKTNEDKK